MKYGWLADRPDQRDYEFDKVNLLKRLLLPSSVDLRSSMPPIYEQGDLGSCTANAIASALDYERGRQAESFMTPSRLFIYYNERVDEGTVSSDSGATIRESAKTVAKKGACPESIWPYDVAKFKKKPSVICYNTAVNFESIIYSRVKRTLADFKSCLSQGFSFVFGFTVYESFENDIVTNTGVVPMPKKNEAVLGGHAVQCVGYDDAKKCFICKNSWGISWGDKGYFYMPYSYLLSTKLSSDFWAIQKVK
jgi:C1A family cysteine protease